MAAPKGNKYGANKGRYREALRIELAHKFGTVEDGYRAIARRQIELALRGDTKAIQEIADREDGKPVQDTNLNVTGSSLVEAINSLPAIEMAGAGSGAIRNGSAGGDPDSSADTSEPGASTH